MTKLIKEQNNLLILLKTTEYIKENYQPVPISPHNETLWLKEPVA